MSGIVAQNVGRPSGLIKAAGGGGGTWVEIKTLTASSSSTLSFVDGSSGVVLDSTYPIYCFHCINLHPSEVAELNFNLSEDTGSNYNVTKTTTAFATYSAEAEVDTDLSYRTADDLAQSTAFQTLSVTNQIGADNDESTSGYLYLFNPSSTTFVKHFMASFNGYHKSNYTMYASVAGYGNTTSAVDAVQFKMDSGDIDSGKIKLFGIKDS